MTADPKDKRSPLAAMADAYEPSAADRDRNFKRLATALDEMAPPARAASPASATTLLGLSCIVAVLGLGAWVAVRSGERSPPGTSSTSTAVPTVLASASVPSSSASVVGLAQGEALAAGVSIHDLPAASPMGSLPSRARVAAASRPSTEPSAGTRESTLERETRLIADADTALREGDAARALALLEEHARLFPQGWLANDRAGEQVLVLCALGQRERAAREAKAFLQGRATSPLTRRIERSCAGKAGE